MPRPNKGLRLRYLPERQSYYIVWYERGQKRIKSTGTNCPDAAAKVLAAFKDDPTSISHSRLSFSIDLPMRRKGAMQAVYFIGGNVGGVKIGVAINIEDRLKTLQTGSPVPLSVLATVPGDRTLEGEYHRRFAKYRLHGEWFAQVGEVADEIARLQKAR